MAHQALRSFTFTALDDRPSMSYITDMRRAIRHCASWQKGHIMTSITTIRAALINQFGARKYRITKAGEIHVWGVMPNASGLGWYLYGWMGDKATLCRLGVDE